VKRSLYILGFAIGLLVFVGLNLYSYHIAVPPCCDLVTSFGFPLAYGSFGGFVDYTGYRIDLLLLNFVIGGFGSATFALFFQRLVPPVLSFARDVVTWHAKTRLSQPRPNKSLDRSHGKRVSHQA
jgi:hypothetical protein